MGTLQLKGKGGYTSAQGEGWVHFSSRGRVGTLQLRGKGRYISAQGLE